MGIRGTFTGTNVGPKPPRIPTAQFVTVRTWSPEPCLSISAFAEPRSIVSDDLMVGSSGKNPVAAVLQNIQLSMLEFVSVDEAEP